MKERLQLIVIGGSAGSLEILLSILPEMHRLNLPIVIVLHRKNTGDTILVDLLATRTEMPVKEAEEKEQLLGGVVYVAPADYHLLIEFDASISFDTSEKVNYSRPSIDVTFESAANAFHQGVAAVLLSGANADGVMGLKKIKASGGVVIVQDPAAADVPYMPQQAINAVQVDFILTRETIGDMVSFLER